MSIKSYFQLLEIFKEKLKECYYVFISERWNRKILKRLGIPKSRISCENEYREYWKSIVKYPTPYAYRLYGHFNSYDKRVVSQAASNKINDILNPKEYYGYICDKNNFDAYIGSVYFPNTIVRKINGGYYNADYHEINIDEAERLINQAVGIRRIIVKPSVGSDSGRGVELYEKSEIDKHYHLYNHSEITLDCQRLKILGDNFIIQEALSQSQYLSQFNPSSINTIRIATYRSVVDNQVHILSSVIRIGQAGAIIDNLHAGGCMVRIDENGYLANYCINQFGERNTIFNKVDFKNNIYRIPEFDRIIDFAKLVSSKIVHARLVQLDITVDVEGFIRLIEYNTIGFSMWISQFTGSPAFGQYTDEIRQYAIEHL